jgi:hypothetical protein
MDLYNHSPIRLQGVVLNWLSTGTTLPFTLQFCPTCGGRFEYFHRSPASHKGDEKGTQSLGA